MTTSKHQIKDEVDAQIDRIKSLPELVRETGKRSRKLSDYPMSRLPYHPQAAQGVMTEATSYPLRGNVLEAASFVKGSHVLLRQVRQVVDHSPLTISMAFVIWLSLRSARASGESSRRRPDQRHFPQDCDLLDVNQPKTGTRSQ